MPSERRRQTTRRRPAAACSLMGLAVFVGILVGEHFFHPGLSGLTHQISEYANHRDGWLMKIGFMAWAASLGAAAIVQIQRHPAALAICISALMLVVAAVALIVAALFNTETVAGHLPRGAHLTASGRLHDVGSGVATLSIAGAALADACARSTTAHVRRLTWSVIGCAIVADVALLMVGPGVGGLRERILVGLGCAWQAAFAFSHLDRR